jgi:type VI secretion system secreted protein Hcp
MAIEGYLSFELAKQGKNKGTSPRPAYRDKIPFIAFEYDVVSPRDAASGQTGKRQHGPVRIVKEWDANTPILFQALVSNEQVKTAKFEFVRVDPKSGIEEVYFRITLSDGAVTKVQPTSGGGVGGAAAATQGSKQAMDVETINFSFNKITLEHLIDKTMAEDSFKQV